MRKSLSSFITITFFNILLILFISCGHTDKKTDNSTDSLIKKDSATKTNNSERPPDNRIPTDNGQASTTNTIYNKPKNDDILANIDQYLVSTAIIPNPSTSGGITNTSVTVKNNLADITIQKAIIEVSILTDDGAEFRTDYYILQNIEPGELETIKIPNATRGNSIVSHVVKLKSQELTNGEMVTVGHRITPK